MRKLMMSKKGSGTARVTAKAVACMLSIMLVVTGIVPGFAVENKISKQEDKKIAKSKAVQKGQSQISKQSGKKPVVSKEEAGKDKQKQSDKKFSKEKEGAKKNKIKNKKDRYFDLNPEGNIRARFTDGNSLYIFAKDINGNMYIRREKWKEMVLALGGIDASELLYWNNHVVKLIKFQTDGIYLPSDCTAFFGNFAGIIKGCELLISSNVTNMSYMFSGTKDANPNVSKWDTSKVTNMRSMFSGAAKADLRVADWDVSNVKNMSHMFSGARNANPGVSGWNVSGVRDMNSMFARSGIRYMNLSNWKLDSLEFKKDMFEFCGNLEYLQTPAGLKTFVSGAKADFKIVKLKKGYPVEVEKEIQSLHDGYIINNDGDKQAIYHIYHKDKYGGVIFDKNGGDTESWVNHNMHALGYPLNSGGYKMPGEEPMRAGHTFLGWAKNSNATVPDFDGDTIMRKDIRVYAVWQRKPAKTFYLNASGNIKANMDNGVDIVVTANNTSGDMTIDREKWKEMVLALGGTYDPDSAMGLDWGSDIMNIKFQTDGIYLPSDSSTLFSNFRGTIMDCDRLKTNNVTNMFAMFYHAAHADPNVSTWDTSNVTDMRVMFKGARNADPDVSRWDVSGVKNMYYMFFDSKVGYMDLSGWKLNSEILNSGDTDDMFGKCNKLIYLKTPAGLKTSISGADANFKIVKLKEWRPVEVEQENQNLNEEYEINKNGDEKVIYHIYRKDKYAGVIFDINGGDSESWVNHEIVMKGYKISSYGIPAEEPTRFGYKFLGWAKTPNATAPNFNANTKIYNDMKVYAVWKKIDEFALNSSGNVRAKLNSDNDIIVTAMNNWADMNIERIKWIDMIESLGGYYNEFDHFTWWNGTAIRNIYFQAAGVRLPSDSGSFFWGFRGQIYGCELLKTDDVEDMSYMFMDVHNANPNVSNWDTSKVRDMGSMFSGARTANPDVSKWNTSNVKWMYHMFYQAESANPDVSKWNTSSVKDLSNMFYAAESANPDVSRWDVSKVTDMGSMFGSSGIKTADLSGWKLHSDILEDYKKSDFMFTSCRDLEYLKTPAGLRTAIDGANNDFKIVKLKEEIPATVDEESKNLESKYEINEREDKDAIYHIYRKDKYAGVIFNKNDGKREAWFNHGIVEKGKSFLECGGGGFPSQRPTKKEYVCIGWAKGAKSTEADFRITDPVNEDMTVYAVFKLDRPTLIMKVKAKKIKKGRKKVKVRVLSFRFRPSKAASGYVSDVIIKGKVKKIKLKKGRKKLRGFIVGKITLPLKGKLVFRLRGFKKTKGKRHYGIMLYENIDWFGTVKM